MRSLVILLCVMKAELLMGEMVLHGGDGGMCVCKGRGGCMAAWRSSRDGEERPGEWKSIQIQGSPDRP